MTISSASPLVRKPATFREFVYLSLPLMLALCTTSLVGFCDRAFLAHSSMLDLEGYVSGFVLVRFYQIPLMRLTTLGQAFVSFYECAGGRRQIGVFVWQMIWFSLLSMFIIVPVGYLIMPLVFGGTLVQESATSYFTWMLWGMFLFPLQMALSAFFVGQKKTKVVFMTTIAAQCVHVLLEYFLILGIGNVLPPLGSVGAAIASIVDQLLICLVLLFLFLRKKERELYGTGNYHFNWKVFCEQMRAGLPAAAAPFVSVASWVATSRIMALNGADYMTVFSIGTTLTACFTFIPDALLQAVTTSVSGALGKNDFSAVRRSITHALKLLGITMLLLFIPYVLFPQSLLYLLSVESHSASSKDLLFSTCYFSWLYLLCQGIQWIGYGLVTATRQTVFFIFTGCLQWATGYLPILITIELCRCDAKIFWLLTTANALTIGALFYWKGRQLLSFRKQELLG
jgi:MATE family multidrug resistance protein